jgi:predicted phage-related endonuclease
LAVTEYGGTRSLYLSIDSESAHIVQSFDIWQPLIQILHEKPGQINPSYSQAEEEQFWVAAVVDVVRWLTAMLETGLTVTSMYDDRSYAV